MWEKKTFTVFMHFLQTATKVFPANVVHFAVKMALLAYFCRKRHMARN